MSELAAIETRATMALAGREVRRVLSLWTQTIAPAVVTALLYLAIFGGALGSRLEPVGGIDYAAFILPGLLVMTVAAQSFSNNATSIFQATYEGYVEDVLTSPMRPWQLAAAYLSGGVVRSLAAAALVAAAASPVIDIEQPALLSLVLVLTALLFGSLGVITGIWSETFDQHSFVANLVITPLALVAGVFYPAGELPRPWETLTLLDPVFYLVDAARAGVTGFSEAAVGASLAVAAVVAAALFALAVRLLATGWRIKP